MSRRHFFILVSLMLLLGLTLAACGGAETPEPAQEVTPCPEVPECPECPTCPEVIVSDVPFEEEWFASAHADAEAEAFNHWNEDDPVEVPAECAKCHSTPGYLDFLGEDGSAFGVVDAAAPIGTVVECQACHNDTTVSMTSVVFPSGIEITGLGDESRCMQCHQGRSSTVTVNDAIAELGLEGSPDTANEELGFINIHYYAAAASLYGSEVQGGYQYEGKNYQIRFAHVEEYDTCLDCHNPHTLELKVEQCSECHEGVAAVEDLHNVRMEGSLADYDGDGDTEEGIYYEVQGLQEKLMEAMQAYANEVLGAPIAYDSHAYPYFFQDTNGDGEAGEDEAVFPNAYNAFSPRLLKAAYNYQVSLKDPGAYAHNAKYHIALLYDSIESLNEVLSSPVSLAARNDPGHFDGTAEAFRHWDEEDPAIVPASCTKCHTSEGLPQFLAEGVTTSQEPSNSFACSTCHTFSEEGIAVRAVANVTFPSGAALTFPDNPESNLCMSCHQGRSSTVSLEATIASAGVGNDVVSESLSAANTNPHYFAAGATMFGSEAQGGYQYAGKTYVGRNEHRAAVDSCAECHSVHALEVDVEQCSSCHATSVPENIRAEENTTDYDGDGDATEGIAGEVEGMRVALLAAIQAYAADTAETPVVYSGANYPYWFIDTNGDGSASPDETIYPNQYASWTPKMLRAAYNYNWATKDPGAYVHNGDYTLQLLYDSLQDIGGAQAVAGMTRP